MRLLHDIRLLTPIPVLLLSAILTSAPRPGSSAREQSPGLAQSPPETIGLDPGHLRFIDAAVMAAIQRGDIPSTRIGDRIFVSRRKLTELIEGDKKPGNVS